MAQTLGVLVAGGAGSRLGTGRPKALATLGGVTLLARALAVLAATCDAIVVALPATMTIPIPDRVVGAGGERPVRRVDDAPGTAGPLAGLVAGLGAGGAARAIVLGVDLPFVEPAMLAGLLGRLGGRHAVVPAPAGFPQPLAAAYAAAAGPILAARLAAGERAPTRALAALDALVLDDAALSGLPGGPGSFFNLNTPGDLAAAERRIAGGKAAT